MRLHRIRWRIALPYVVLILVTMAALAVYLSGLLRSAYLDQLQVRLGHESLLLADAMGPAFRRQGPPEAYTDTIQHYAQLLGARVTVIAADGTVLADTEESPGRMDNHLYRPEVQRALAVGQGSAIRYSDTVGYDMMYLATLVTVDGQPKGIVRVALSMREIGTHIARLHSTILVATIVAAALALLLSVGIAERAGRPVRWLTETVQRMAAGDLNARLVPTTHDEVGTLTAAFNGMADHLRETITSLDQERGRLATVLEHMADGALIVDGQERVRLVNPAALRLLDTTAERALGRTLAEVVRHHQIIGVWRSCHEVGEEQVDLVEVVRQGLFLQVVATPLSGREPQGCLLILQDLTRVRRLETVRRDFISNISHELRTPLASVKALTETLRDGALEDRPAAQRFLERMEIEVDAMTQMVEELLELSRIESGRVPLHLESTAVAAAVLPSVDRLRPQADRAALQLSVVLPSDLPPVLADVERIQQVLANLLHNAIKFTPAGGVVTVSASATDDEVIFSVRDTGVGIPAEVLPRIFERFFKADRSRSGGGTGLGLSIAKHVVQAHGGRIWAESVEGEGSTFYFALPTAPTS